jgi:hypothetical protein
MNQKDVIVSHRQVLEVEHYFTFLLKQNESKRSSLLLSIRVKSVACYSFERVNSEVLTSEVTDE